MKNPRLILLEAIDSNALQIATTYTNNKPVSELLLSSIKNLYDSAKIEREFYVEGRFEVAYHAPITSELEFFIARILFHFSEIKKLHWKIYLRRQKRKTAPDIRIEINDKTIAIIEVKAKGGWIQPFLSDDRYDNEIKKFVEGVSDPNKHPDLIRKKVRNQLDNYRKAFKLPGKNIFFVLPTLALVNRKHYNRTYEDYRNMFKRNSGLPKSNYILLSQSLVLDLSYKRKRKNIDIQMEPTECFEYMLKTLSKIR